MGTIDWTTFTFTGLYATNASATTGGRLQGGSNLGTLVPGWPTGELRAFEVVGWSASLGPEFQPAWLSAGFPIGFGWSPIATGAAGAFNGGEGPGGPLPLFGPAPSLTSGFTIVVPEPEMVNILVVALGTFLWDYRQR